MNSRTFLVPFLATLLLACTEENVTTDSTSSSGGSSNAGASGAAGSAAGAGGASAGAAGSGAGAGGTTAGAGGSDAGAGGAAAGSGNAGEGGSGNAGGSDAGQGGSSGASGEGGSDAAGSGGAAAGSGGSDTAGAGGSDAGAGGEGGSPGAICGGKTGKQCDKGDFCNVDGHCGFTDGTGTCEATPQGCPEDCPGVCGCDGQFYCNTCSAHALGVSVSESKDCLGAGGSGQGGSGSGGSGQGGEGGSPGAICGGKTGKQCDKGDFCNVDGHCGFTDGTGTCEATPADCAKDCPGVCGCDGQFYCNACLAHAQGVSVSDSASCLPVEDCSPLAAKLQPEFQLVGACTTVVRLDYSTKEILGYAVRCGKYSFTDEKTARSAAVASTGFGADSQQIAGANPEDEFLFFQPPSDIGNVAAVHRRTGLAVFGGSIIGLGKGDITFPKEWRPASDLGKNCDSGKIVIPPARGFDLQGGQPLPEADTQAALQVVWKTALPQAMAQANYIFDAMVLLYPRSVFAFDPTTAEWIVLLNGGWLE